MIGKSHGTDRVGACVCVRVRAGRGGGGKRIGEYRALLEPVRSQNCKIPPVHELKKKRESNGQLLTSWEKICTVKNSDLGLENTAL